MNKQWNCENVRQRRGNNSPFGILHVGGRTAQSMIECNCKKKKKQKRKRKVEIVVNEEVWPAILCYYRLRSYIQRQNVLTHSHSQWMQTHHSVSLVCFFLQLFGWCIAFKNVKFMTFYTRCQRNRMSLKQCNPLKREHELKIPCATLPLTIYSGSIHILSCVTTIPIASRRIISMRNYNQRMKDCFQFCNFFFIIIIIYSVKTLCINVQRNNGDWKCIEAEWRGP